jgi:hypothetical protein
VHIANVCGIVGTDIEFQSWTLADGTERDYAILGTIGQGTQIIDITNPLRPEVVASYKVQGANNDVALLRAESRDLLFVAFDESGHNTSPCLNGHGGVDIVDLHFDPDTGSFHPRGIACYATRNGAGAHTITLHPSGKWLSINTAQEGIEVLLVDTIQENATLGEGPRLTGDVDRAHDVSFSGDGSLLFSAGVDTASIVPLGEPTWTQAGAATTIRDPQVDIFHQADLAATGGAGVLVVSDEKPLARLRQTDVDREGDGNNDVRCHVDGSNENVGGLHFYSPVTGAPLGTWTSNPILPQDELDQTLRVERGCSVHVFRVGGNGSSGPGGPNGVSSLPPTQLVVGHYGAGVWWVDFASVASGTSTDRKSVV